jgi:predicted acyltransferase
VQWALGCAAILLAAGWALTPFGISKIRATPTWCLYCDGASVVLFLILYWVADVKHRTRWAAFVKPAGSNTLMTYLLPYILYAMPGYLAIAAYWDQGWPGVIRSFLFTGVVLGLAALLTRWKIRLQL